MSTQMLESDADFATAADRRKDRSPRWEQPAKYAMLLGTLVAYLWNLGANGWANSFYSAAVQAGSVNWESFLFGSSDASNSITVDKPPASLWPMELSVRIFGLNSWAILVPEVLMGVGTVWLLYSCVRRYFGPGAGLLAGSILSVTPVAALMFRFNNPDALLTLLLTAATALTLRAIETERMRWLIGAGVAVGFAFLTKQLQAFLVLPALVCIYAYAGPRTFLRRVGDLLAALVAVVVSAGWWVAIVELVPATSRPYIGGSQNNSFLQLTFGYNGFGRLTGNETGSVTPGGGRSGSVWGSTGITRMFGSEVGSQISWLLPTALLLLVVGLALRGCLPRTDLRRATILAFGGTLAVTSLAFSFMAGIFHQYYTVALAPFIAVVVAAGAHLLWEMRADYRARIAMAVTNAVTAWWAWVLLDRTADWQPWIRVVVVMTAIVGIGVLLIPTLPGSINRRLSAVAMVAAIGTGLLGPAAYAIETISTGHSGSIPTAGPAGASNVGGPRGFRGGMPNFGGANAGAMPGIPPSFRGQAGMPNAGPRTGGMGLGGGAAGGLLNSSNVGNTLKALLEKDGSQYTWVAAAIGSNSASGYQLATQLPVMPIGGFNGSDPSPSLAQFESYVAQGKIHYFIAGGGVGQANGGSNVGSQISSWVESHFKSQTVDGVTIYDLTSPTS
ncbi:MAG TPA: glycosyltransferase family 39 protein [Marmoricola sp.]|nr:glycosyltransferase family 39 protein [Marmoricola sp.]